MFSFKRLTLWAIVLSGEAENCTANNSVHLNRKIWTSQGRLYARLARTKGWEKAKHINRYKQLAMKELIDIWNFNVIATKGGLLISIGDILLTVLMVLAGYVLSRFAEFVLARRLAKTDLRPDSVQILKRIIFYAILVMVILTIMSLLGIPITAFAFATGAIAIGVGFGAQNIINNFISGWILMAERPIRVNDFIEVEGFMGTVKRVGTRSTLVHRLDGVHVLVPNSKLLENTVVNWTLIDGLIRNSVRVGVAYGSNIDQVRSALEQAISTCADVLTTPEAEYVFEDFGDNALIFDIYFWSDMTKTKPLRLVRSDVRMAIARALDKEGIVVAFPQRDVHLYTEKPIEVQVRKQEE